jgi:hypothetical protein
MPQLKQLLVVTHLDYAVDIQQVAKRLPELRKPLLLFEGLLLAHQGFRPDFLWFDQTRPDIFRIERELMTALCDEGAAEYVSEVANQLAYAWARLHKEFKKLTDQRLVCTYAQPSPLKNVRLVNERTRQWVYALLERPRRPFNASGFWPFSNAVWLGSTGGRG